MDLATAFIDSATANAGKTAVYWGDETRNYDWLHERSRYLADHLAGEAGIAKGDRVAIWLANCPEFIAAMQAILRAGAVVVPINHFLQGDEVAYILRDSGARMVITDETCGQKLESIGDLPADLQCWRIESFPETVEPKGGVRADLKEEDLAVIIYTSGTTGRPKGAMLSHGNLLANVFSCREMLRAAEGDRFVLLLPMFHSFMLTVCNLLPLVVGGSIVLIRSLHPPRNVMAEIVRHQATILPAIPPFFRAMLHDSVPTELPLRLCISGAAPLPVETLNAFTGKFSFPLIEGYGLSEASPAVCFNPLEGPWVAGSIGKPLPEVEVSVRDDDGQPLPEGEVGEICVRGGNVMVGYWERPEETSETIRDGWLYTGDVGYRDADGYFYITDRKKDMLLVNGINVYPREIEEVIYRFPGIKEAAVVGRPDARKGEIPVAFVVANDGADVDSGELLEFLKERLAAYKVPRRILALEALPRNATGKILKTELRGIEI